MELLFVLDHRFARTPDGAVWTDTSYAEPFFDRYLSEFDSVRVISRTRDVAAPEPAWRRVNGGRVTVQSIPYYVGPAQYIRRAAAVRRAVRRALENPGPVLMRVPSQLSTCVESELRRLRRPFALEVVGDPWDSLAPHATHHPLRPLLRPWYFRNQSRQCRLASAVCYVAAELQTRYPGRPGAFSLVCSDVVLPEAAFRARPSLPGLAPVILTVGSLAQIYKGVDVLLDALALCRESGARFKLRVIGDGRHRAELEQRARTLGIASLVEFSGQIQSGPPIEEALDDADLFVLPSRTEGMPRALLEAMARSLPCLASAVGGIPGLLAPEDLLAPGDTAGLARAIQNVLAAPDRMAAMARRNYARARDFRDELLTPRRAGFYKFIGANLSGATAPRLSSAPMLRERGA